jgi:hypothetical protein
MLLLLLIIIIKLIPPSKKEKKNSLLFVHSLVFVSSLKKKIIPSFLSSFHPACLFQKPSCQFIAWHRNIKSSDHPPTR